MKITIMQKRGLAFVSVAFFALLAGTVYGIGVAGAAPATSANTALPMQNDGYVLADHVAEKGTTLFLVCPVGKIFVRAAGVCGETDDWGDREARPNTIVPSVTPQEALDQHFGKDRVRFIGVSPLPLAYHGAMVDVIYYKVN